MPVILPSTQSVVVPDAAELASVTPSDARTPGAMEVMIMAMAGTSATYQFQVESSWMTSGRGAGASLQNHLTVFKGSMPLNFMSFVTSQAENNPRDH